VTRWLYNLLVPRSALTKCWPWPITPDPFEGTIAARRVAFRRLHTSEHIDPGGEA
jgi:hypothetical protein